MLVHRIISGQINNRSSHSFNIVQKSDLTLLASITIFNVLIAKYVLPATISHPVCVILSSPTNESQSDTLN